VVFRVDDDAAFRLRAGMSLPPFQTFVILTCFPFSSACL
jgi:hypothetical protein